MIVAEVLMSSSEGAIRKKRKGEDAD
jgi:hypothetical protein